MKHKFTAILAILIIPLLTMALSACSDDVSFKTQEAARQQASVNAEHNARAWRDSYAPEFKIMMRGDSTIGPKCAQGDGWVTVDLKKGNKVIELKCSSVSGSIGCLAKPDFQERKEYAKQDGRCNKDIPFPLPKIVM